MSRTTVAQVRFRTIGGIRIRYADRGGSSKPAVVPTSPWPPDVGTSAALFAADPAVLDAVTGNRS